MNNKRRKELRKAVDMLRDASSIVADAGQEEEDYAENMPENMQDGDKYERAMEVVDILSDAEDLIDEAIGKIEEAI